MASHVTGRRGEGKHQAARLINDGGVESDTREPCRPGGSTTKAHAPPVLMCLMPVGDAADESHRLCGGRFVYSRRGSRPYDASHATVTTSIASKVLKQ